MESLKSFKPLKSFNDSDDFNDFNGFNDFDGFIEYQESSIQHRDFPCHESYEKDWEQRAKSGE